MKICVICGTEHERPNMKPCCSHMQLEPIRKIWEQWLLLAQRNKTLEVTKAPVRSAVSVVCPNPNCGATFEVNA